jgi:hypothetical protein
MASLKRILIVATRGEVGRLGAAGETRSAAWVLSLTDKVKKKERQQLVLLVVALMAAGATGIAETTSAHRFLFLTMLSWDVLLVVHFARQWTLAKLVHGLLSNLEPPAVNTVVNIVANSLG